MSKLVVFFEQSHFLNYNGIKNLFVKMNHSKEAPNCFLKRHKAAENKPVNMFFPKDYEDEKHQINQKNSDSAEVYELKNKLKLVMTKLSTVKKQKESLQKQNKNLEGEVLNLQSNLRQMVAGFSNTSSNFPIHNQIGSKFAEFYKYQCLDMFFDFLCPQLSMKGIIRFYFLGFEKADDIIKSYFQPGFRAIKSIGCFQSLDGPIMNVMRKAFQTTHTQIFKKIEKNNQIHRAVLQIQKELNINESNEETNNEIRKFLIRLIELRFYCFISDPPFEINMTQIGIKTNFNSLIHDPFDGFIKPKEECWVVLPSVRKSGQDKQIVAKSLVLQADYDLIN